MTKIKRTLWLSSFKDGTFWIVEIENEGWEKKYYIGSAVWDDEKRDAERIYELWAPLYPETVKRFFNF